MDIAYLHLITNHIPIIGVPFGIAVLLLAMWRKSMDLAAAAYLIFTFLGAATLIVFFLGQGGEDFVEDLPGVSHDSIEDHEEFAIFPLVAVLITAAASLFALVRYGGIPMLLKRGEAGSDRSVPSWLSAAVLVLALVSAGLLGYLGRLGGKIRHPEFHGGVTAAKEAEPEADAASEGEDESGRGRGRNRGER